MGNSIAAIAKILLHEGGYVNNPKDPGGPTNKGITLATFRSYIKPSGTIADLKALTTEQATVVYKRQYWDRVMGDSLPSGVAYAVADFGVNSGPSRAIKELQAVVGVERDGRIGPDTLKAVQSHDPRDLINGLCDRRLAFMKRIRHRKTRALLWDTYKNGWSKRVADVRLVSLGWVVDTQQQPDTPERTSKAQSTTVQATAGAAIATAGGAFTALSQLDPITQLAVVGFASVALICLGWILRERLRKWADGDR